MSRSRTLAQVLMRSARLVPWWHLGLGIAAAFALAATRRHPYPNDLVFGLRAGAVALAASAAFVFDDPAASIVSGKPVPISIQRLSRLVLALPVVGVAWVVLFGWMNAGLGPVEQRAMPALPFWSLTLELMGLFGIVWAVATLVMSSGREAAGAAAVATLLVVVVALLLLPRQLAFFPSPASPPLPGEVASSEWEAWVAAHRRWTLLAVSAWAAVGLGLVGRIRGSVLRRVPSLRPRSVR